MYAPSYTDSIKLWNFAGVFNYLCKFCFKNQFFCLIVEIGFTSLILRTSKKI